MTDVAAAVTAYLATGQEYAADEVASALAAEQAAQAHVCRVPAAAIEGSPPPVWPADLVEALCRRVAANLAARAFPLGVKSEFAEVTVATSRVGGTDREVARLERPYRKLVVG